MLVHLGIYSSSKVRNNFSNERRTSTRFQLNKDTLSVDEILSKFNDIKITEQVIKAVPKSMSSFIQSIKDKTKGIMIEPNKYTGGYKDEK